MGKIVSLLSADGMVMCHAADTTDIVSRAEYVHQTSAVVTAGLGRLLTAASLMGFRLKAEDDSLTLRIKGDGPVGTLIAVSDSQGNVRGYPENPVVELPLNEHGKLDVAGAVGKDGMLYVMRDFGMHEPYIGTTPIVSGEIAEDIAYYYATSDQIPTVCALGVLVDTDLTVISAGGFIAQLLPGASEAHIEQLEKNVNSLPSITEMLSSGKTTEEIAGAVLSGFEPVKTDEIAVEYQCKCSRERVEKALISLGREELLAMAEEQDKTVVDCHFCNKKYRFSVAEIKVLAGI